MNRRTFFQLTLASVGAMLTFSNVIQAEERRRGGSASGPAASVAPGLVNPNDPAAKSVNYVNSNSAIKDVKLQTERSGVKFKDQSCKACSFYQKDKETTVEGKKAAPCLMPFAKDKVVSADGWCTSWAKK